MKAVSFNVNSIRTRLHQLEAVVEKYQPDFIGLQETKVTDDQFPVDDIRALGYHVEFYGQKTHYGVALLSLHPFQKVIKGFPGDLEESQRRFIGGVFESPLGGEITVLNGYFPQGENREHPTKFPNKKKFYEDLHQFLDSECKAEEQVLVMGDMNVSHTDLDIGIGEQNRKRWLREGKCSFLPEEREWLQGILDLGLKDTFRHHQPDDERTFSWFDYRSKGFDADPKRGLRIDLILANQHLLEHCKDAGVDYDIRGMERPSDHCPIWATFA
ncbi:exodeoxyribonuclease III [Marinimicrobium sp. ARAG 43.8]|uniref:exodeoxyribonuclease III n=1 Tax=Marinimicrobium sp. ARAG 43.8 TaxID=3418719 RepID=UPI003CF0D222